MSKEGFKIYTVYDHPTDYPDDYVVRTWYTEDKTEPTPNTELFIKDKSIEVVREKLSSMGLVCIDREKYDDEKILETWL